MRPDGLPYYDNKRHPKIGARMYCLEKRLPLIVTVILACSADIWAQPNPLHDDITITKIGEVPRRTMRIAKDPRNNDLYTLSIGGTIYRMAIPRPSERTPFTVAVGRLDPGSSTRIWTKVVPEQAMPEGFPLEAIRQRVAENELTAKNPLEDDLLYFYRATDASIRKFPRTLVYEQNDFDLEPIGGFYIDPEGTFYLGLDVESANAGEVVSVATSTDHGLNDTQGFDIGLDGTFYIAGNSYNRIVVMRGERTGDAIEWVEVARTEPIPRGTKSHPHPAIVLSPDDRYVYINSGSRTDHGEISPADGQNAREMPLSSSILRVPAGSKGVIIPSSEAALSAAGYRFADGLRNAFDMAFAPNGDLFATDNGPDADMADELNWIRHGHHYGFPWRFGTVDNPMQAPDYDPASDFYILPKSQAAQKGWYYNDPDFPPQPMAFTDPVVNLGPDADRYREPVLGDILDASDESMTASTFTPHSSPLGLVFDVENAMGGHFQGDGFILRIGGDCCDLIDHFKDPDLDLLHMEMKKQNGKYEAYFTRLVEGFAGPIDAEIIENRIYVIEWSGERGIWEVSLPARTATAVRDGTRPVLSGYSLEQSYPNPFNPQTTITYRLAEDGPVNLVIFNATGQRVRTLVNAERRAGNYSVEWDGRSDDGQVLASGIYLYRIESGPFRHTRRLVLVR